MAPLAKRGNLLFSSATKFRFLTKQWDSFEINLEAYILRLHLFGSLLAWNVFIMKFRYNARSDWTVCFIRHVRVQTHGVTRNAIQRALASWKPFSHACKLWIKLVFLQIKANFLTKVSKDILWNKQKSQNRAFFCDKALKEVTRALKK